MSRNVVLTAVSGLLGLSTVLSASDSSRAADQATTSTSSAPASAKRPATASTAPTVEDIRAMMEQAISLKNDPKRAQELMVKASELVKQLPPGSDLSRLVVEFSTDTGSINHLLKPTETKELIEKKKLSEHIELSEKYLSSTYPFTGLADNGKGAILPAPMTDKVLTEQCLLLSGTVIFKIANDPRRDTRWQTYYVSPDEKYVVLQDWLRSKPTRVLSVGTGKTVTVEPPEPRIEGHDNVYPFSFSKWNKDSKSFIVEVNGSDVKGPGQMIAFRELWEVQADTGAAKHVKRQEQPWQEKLKWDD